MKTLNPNRLLGLATASAFLALLTLRIRLVEIAGIPLGLSTELGFVTGAIHDLFFVLLALSLAVLLGSRSRALQLSVWGIFSFTVWFSSYANTLYFEYFGSHLRLWNILGQVGFLKGVWRSALSLSLTPSILLSFALFGASGFFFYSSVRKRSLHELAEGRPFSFIPFKILRPLTLGIGLVVACLVFRQSVVWARMTQNYIQPPAFQALLVWWMDFNDYSDKTMKVVSKTEITAAKSTLLNFRNYRRDSHNKKLLSSYEVDKNTRSMLRDQLGLRQDRDPNVVYLFLESVRTFEMFHPEHGKQIYPKLHQLMSKHGIAFKRAYSSGTYTNMGHFSTLCSTLPYFHGSGVFEHYPGLRIVSVSELLSKQGYATMYASGLQQEYGNIGVFEAGHGTRIIRDLHYFKSLGATSTVADWGLDDHQVMERATDLILKENAEGRPAFMSLMTISTHHPFITHPKGVTLPQSVMEWAGDAHKGDYAVYLKRNKYLDQASYDFIQKLFESEYGDSTLVVIVGDQRFYGFYPDVELSDEQKREIAYRIPLVLVTKNMKSPAVHDYPVHQMDITPTIADVVGLKGDVTWLGRNMLMGEGSPFIYHDQYLKEYLVEDQRCFGDVSGTLKCIEAAQEILWSEVKSTIPAKASAVEFVKAAVLANSILVENNQFLSE